MLVVSGSGSVTFSMMMVPQVSISIGTGAMKSFTAEVSASEARDLTYAEENPVHSFGSITPASVRLMAASPKVSMTRVCPDRSADREPPPG